MLAHSTEAAQRLRLWGVNSALKPMWWKAPICLVGYCELMDLWIKCLYAWNTALHWNLTGLSKMLIKMKITWSVQNRQLHSGTYSSIIAPTLYLYLPGHGVYDISTGLGVYDSSITWSWCLWQLCLFMVSMTAVPVYGVNDSCTWSLCLWKLYLVVRMNYWFRMWKDIKHLSRLFICA